jgi:hypothetical protein
MHVEFCWKNLQEKDCLEDKSAKREANIKKNLKDTTHKGVGYIHLPLYRDQWWVRVDTVIKFGASEMRIIS